MKEFDWTKIRKQLHEGVVRVTFKKANGDLREMDATLADYLLPEIKGKGSTHSGDETTIVFDLDKNAWRSFRHDRVVHVEVYDV